MNHARQLWIAFGIGVLIVITALGWATVLVISLEQRNAQSVRMHQRDESIRLALWRMDSRLAPMIALEATRPAEEYTQALGRSAVLPGAMMQLESDQASTDSTDSYARTSYNSGYFEIDADGLVKGTDDFVEELANRFESTGKTTPLKQATVESTEVAEMDPELLASADEVPQPRTKIAADYDQRQQLAEFANIRSNRSAAQSPKKDTRAEDSSDRFEEVQAAGQLSDPTLWKAPAQQTADSEEPTTIIGSVEARWIDGDEGPSLVLVRSTIRQGETVLQGTVLDWDEISKELLELVEDLLPRSQLVPMLDDQSLQANEFYKSSNRPYQLATIPVGFIPGHPITKGAGFTGVGITPTAWAMFVTWISVLSAIVAVGLVLRAVLALSDRRGRFVGAVTHELRTPLTTFRLYSQMLADGMITDEQVRQDYLITLKKESDRLTGIVENVLEYARMSRSNTTKSKPKGEQTLTLGEIMARLVPPMSRHGEQSEMDLVVSDETTDHADRTITVDPHAVERIMLNLMDNACKYAGPECDDPRIHLDAKVDSNTLTLIVSDHGPGVSQRDRRKIFGEFIRGSSKTMKDRSGLGLGLALSKGLALEMNGDLELIKHRGHGAEFALTLPLDPA